MTVEQIRAIVDKTIKDLVPPAETGFIKFLKEKYIDVDAFANSESDMDINSFAVRLLNQSLDDPEIAEYLSNEKYSFWLNNLNYTIVVSVLEPGLLTKEDCEDFIDCYKAFSEKRKLTNPAMYSGEETNKLVDYVSSVQKRLEQKGSRKKTGIKPLQWIGTPAILKRLSKELENKGYINHRDDFIKVFEKEERIFWKGSVQYLAYLFFKITDGYKWVKSAGKPPYTKSVEYYFIQYDNSGIIVPPVRIADTLYNVIKRSRKYHAKLRLDVDNFLSLISTIK